MMDLTTDIEEMMFSKIPGEDFLFNSLQKELTFHIGSKTIKQGRLLLFKRKSSFFIQITLFNSKKEKENFEIPFPFKVEEYKEDGVMYFDYRLDALNVETLPHIQSKVASSYFNRILEVVVRPS